MAVGVVSEAMLDSIVMTNPPPDIHAIVLATTAQRSNGNRYWGRTSSPTILAHSTDGQKSSLASSSGMDKFINSGRRFKVWIVDSLAHKEGSIGSCCTAAVS